jgi:fumarate reductase subunit D
MAKSNKPAIWGPFAAGGTLTAFITPALAALLLFAAFGRVPEALGYERLHALASHPMGALAIFVVVTLSLWTSAHRIRITFYDLGVRADTLVAWAIYALAALGTAATGLLLLRL